MNSNSHSSKRVNTVLVSNFMSATSIDGSFFKASVTVFVK